MKAETKTVRARMVISSISLLDVPKHDKCGDEDWDCDDCDDFHLVSPLSDISRVPYKIEKVNKKMRKSAFLFRLKSTTYVFFSFLLSNDINRLGEKRGF